MLAQRDDETISSALDLPAQAAGGICLSSVLCVNALVLTGSVCVFVFEAD